MMLGLYGLLCLALGIAIGAFIGAKFARRRDAAPKPIELSYDTQQPFYGRSEGAKKVVICGAEWTVYGGGNE